MADTGGWFEEDGREYEIIPYKGYDIYYNYYYEDEFTVHFGDHDWWYRTLDDAKKAIDEKVEYDNKKDGKE